MCQLVFCQDAGDVELGGVEVRGDHVVPDPPQGGLGDVEAKGTGQGVPTLAILATHRVTAHVVLQFAPHCKIANSTLKYITVA